MKNSLLLFFLLWYVAAFTEVGELFRLPIMVNHYLAHREKNTTSGIFNFILMHYGSAEEKDADEKGDEVSSDNVELDCYLFDYLSKEGFANSV